jgi:hypothetical protein
MERAAQQNPPWYETMGVPTPGGGWASPEIAESMPEGGLTPEELARIFPGGTGPITEENYGGGPRPQYASRQEWEAAQGRPWYETMGVPTPGGGWASPEIAESMPPQYASRQEWEAAQPPRQYASRQEWEAAQPIRTGETQEPETEDQIEQYLRNATVGGRRPIRTGERTAEERRRLARKNTDEDWEYDPTTGQVNMRTYSRNQFRRAYQEHSHAVLARQREADRIYGQGSGFGQAMAAVYRAQLSGASPLQQVYAQRIQNVANAGIPIGAQPGLITYT